MEKIEKDTASSLVEVLVHGVPLLERIKKKEVDKIKNFEVVGHLLKTVQDEVFIKLFQILHLFNVSYLVLTGSEIDQIFREHSLDLFLS